MTQQRIVKVFVTPNQIVDAMAHSGIDGTVDVVNDTFLVAVAQRSKPLS